MRSCILQQKDVDALGVSFTKEALYHLLREKRIIPATTKDDDPRLDMLVWERVPSVNGWSVGFAAS